MNEQIHTVKFTAAREGGCMAIVAGKVSFPERRGQQPEVGEVWEVRIAGQNPKGNVNFLELIKKVELYEWTWNDGMSSRSRHPACLVIMADGTVHRFTGESIPGVVKVVNSKYTKNGKWSNTTFSCISSSGTKIYSWRQSWEEGYYWPQTSWEEAIATVAGAAPQVDAASLMDVIREHWGKAAEKFDANASAITEFAQI